MDRTAKVFLLLLVFIPTLFARPSSEYTLGPSSQVTSDDGGSTYYPKAQSFRFNQNVQIRFVDLYMRQAYSGPWKVRLLVDLPTGLERGQIDQQDLDSKTIGTAQVAGSSVGWVEFDFNEEIPISGGQMYFLFIDSYDLGDLGPDAQWASSPPGEEPGPYPDGAGWIFVYGWSDNSNYQEQHEKHVDYAFRVYYQVPNPPPWCFSGSTTVQVRGKGYTRMDELKIGDAVQVADGTFTQIYSFGHFAPDEEVEYLQIQTEAMDTPLEISALHMLYLYSGKFKQKYNLVPAHAVSVGDVVVSEQELPATVKSIRKTNRRGAYSPLTESGAIMVNNVAASTYASSNWVPKSVSGDALFYLQHVGTFPIRTYCLLIGGCEQEAYEHGFNAWVRFWFMMEQFLLARLVVSVLLVLLSKPRTTFAAVLLGYYSWKKTHINTTDAKIVKKK